MEETFGTRESGKDEELNDTFELEDMENAKDASIDSRKPLK